MRKHNECYIHVHLICVTRVLVRAVSSYGRGILTVYHYLCCVHQVATSIESRRRRRQNTSIYQTTMQYDDTRGANSITIRVGTGYQVSGDDYDDDDDDDDNDVLTLKIAHFPQLLPALTKQPATKMRLDGRKQTSTK